MRSCFKQYDRQKEKKRFTIVMSTVRTNFMLTIDDEKALEALVGADLSSSHVATIKPEALRRWSLDLVTLQPPYP